MSFIIKKKNSFLTNDVNQHIKNVQYLIASQYVRLRSISGRHQLLASWTLSGTCTSRPSNSLVKITWQPSLEVSVKPYARSSMSRSSSAASSGNLEQKQWSFSGVLNPKIRNDSFFFNLITEDNNLVETYLDLIGVYGNIFI